MTLEHLKVFSAQAVCLAQGLAVSGGRVLPQKRSQSQTVGFTVNAEVEMSKKGRQKNRKYLLWEV